MITFFPHQDAALDDTYDYDHVAYYHDMGLGKTYTGAEKMYELNAPYNLLICQKSKIADWRQHFEEHYDYHVIVYNKQSLDIIAEDTVIIINYELAWRRPELSKLEDFTLMLDESSLIQNEKSKQSKFILSLKPDNVILLSGTPTGGKYERLWSQLSLLGWGISKKLFWKQYVAQEWDEVESQYKITGYKNVPRLKKKMRDFGCHFLKTDDVFDLPAQNDIVIECGNTPLINSFRRDSIIKIDNTTLIGDSAAKALLYMRQLCGHYNKHKIAQLKALIESTDDRLIIFYNFQAECDALKVICDEYERPYSIINGKEKDLTAYDNHTNSVTLLQYQAGAMGLNLQKANKIVYFTLPLGSELFEQSKKRIHRIGQERPCFYYYMMTKNSIEWRIFKTLKERRDYTDELFREEEMKG
ncbi:SNF2-related protein [Listeria booriae]|uniref:SNF2-related protein n=1 Tax=Listeria booriae TaxID=1552123 RepID=UPI001627969F|nr:DEAD/DEAH box helicase [Listeria booriae]MBC2196285.1 DEAD/DEAH box helicase [Listeria booriae]